MTSRLTLDDFDYHLPEELIAKYPPAARGDSRLLVVHRETGKLEDRMFADVLTYLAPNDCLVLNKTKVIPARLFGKRESTGAMIELFLLTRMQGVEEQWQVLAGPARKAKKGEMIRFEGSTTIATVLEERENGERIVEFTGDEPFETFLDRQGHIPLPPYLHREDEAMDRERYQTVFAKEPGAVAAPTAGLHFTTELLETAQRSGVHVAEITLHTGIGTFRPVEVEDVTTHVMHSERYEVSSEAAAEINKAKARGAKVVAVGTTSVRTLETASREDGTVLAESGSSSIFIYPPYRFKVPDAMITNFHMPKSTLLMMISAFASRDLEGNVLEGRELIFNAYRHAIRNGYRFYSYGDAMLLL